MKTYTTSELFTLANNLRKSLKISQKEAFAMAKTQLAGKTSNTLHSELVNQMKVRNVKFTFMNKKGVEITTTGTLMESHIPTDKRKIQGRKVARFDDEQVFYDVRHGVYRTYNINKIVKIIK